jgi:hypothetical protein
VRRSLIRSLVVIGALLSLAVSAALAAPPADKGKPDKPKPAKSASAPGQSTDKNAAKACKAEREKLGAQAFGDKYGTNPNKANAFGKCVSGLSSKGKSDDDDADKDEQAEQNAAKQCKAEREKLGAQAFKDKYGTNHNKANAFGKCVSKIAKAHGSTS